MVHVMVNPCLFSSSFAFAKVGEDPGGSADALMLAVVREGALRFQIPELGVRRVEAGRWALLHDCGATTRITEEAGTRAVRLTLAPKHWEPGAEGAVELPPRLACLRCPRRSASLFLEGPSDGRIRQLATQFEAPAGNNLAARLRQAATANLLFVRVFERPEPQGDPSLGEACAGRAPRATMEAVAADLEAHLDAHHTLAALARRHHTNECDLKRGFRQHFGTTVFGYLRQRRMERAEALLARGDRSVLEVAQAVGYQNPSHFARAFREAMGCNPGELLADLRR
jgi:AraC-like DNA-binding protein